MTKDIRLSIGFLDHPKTIKIQRTLGSDGVLSLIRLWAFAAQYKPDGILTGMDADDIEIASKWNGMQGQLVKALLLHGWLETNPDDIFILHDWEDHQGYVVHSKDRSDKAKRAAATKWQSDESLQRGKITRSQRLSEAREKGRHTSTEWQEMITFFGCCVRCDSTVDELVKDHVVPIYQGGSDSITNLQPLCRSCNSSKGPENIDLRQEWCKDHDIIFPNKWLPNASEVSAKCLLTPAETSAPSPNPYPSPNPKKKTTKVDFVLPEDISPEVWDAFVEHRKAFKTPFTEHAKKLTIQKLNEIGQDKNAVLNQSIEKGWKGVFPLKDNTPLFQNQQPTQQENPVDKLKRQMKERGEI